MHTTYVLQQHCFYGGCYGICVTPTKRTPVWWRARLGLYNQLMLVESV